MLINRILILVFITFINSTSGDESKSRKADIEALRKELEAQKFLTSSINLEKSADKLLEINLVRESIVKSSNPTSLSDSLMKLMKGDQTKDEQLSGIVGMKAQEAIENPNINVIDHHVQEFINTDKNNNRYTPDMNEVKKLSRYRVQSSDLYNLYRENLRIKSIREVGNFTIGINVDQWKTLTLDSHIVLFGLTTNQITIAIGSNGTYELMHELKIESPAQKMSIETMKVWDYNMNKLRSILLLACDKDLIWYELNEANRQISEIRRSRLPKTIDKVSYFQHDGSDLIMLTTIDDQQRIEVEFYEFNLSIEDFWLVQTFKLPNLPEAMVCLDAGRHFLIAFTQESQVIIYRHQHTKFERGKFSFMKAIDAKNASIISGFRIGGHSYLAIGGYEPQIYRYVNGDLQPQSILSQTFGHVEDFLPIPIKIYRDDLVLLVQHRITFQSHSIVAVDALIWNGIAFEIALSVPCRITADPNANGFTCMIDFDREEGLSGSNFIVENYRNSFHVIIPRNDAHSGLFRIKYEIKEAEDPIMKEMEHIQKTIELINGMMDYEAIVKSGIDEFMEKTPLNPMKNFNFDNLDLIEVEAETLRHVENVRLESGQVEFLNGIIFSKEDVYALDLLDNMEKTLQEDENKLRALDAELNKLVRINRQVNSSTKSRKSQDSPIINLGPFSFNGQLHPQTPRISPQQHSNRNKRQIEPFNEASVTQFSSDNIDVETINGIPFESFVFLQNNGELVIKDTDIIFEHSVQVKGDVILPNDGRINKIDLSKEVLAIDSLNFPQNLTIETAFVENLEVESLNNINVSQASLNNLNLNFEDNLPILKAEKAHFRHNLNVESINGMKWDDFVSKLVLKNQPSIVDSIIVNGNLWILEGGRINAEKINSNKFPEEFVMKFDEKGSTVVNGKKIFNGALATNEIDTNGEINGMKPIDMITLDQSQYIPAETTFNVMEVIKKLEVNGTISGQQLDEFLPNPTIEFANEILAACTFKELIIEGNVNVDNSFNGMGLEKVLTDAIYESDIEVVITKPKDFNNLDVKGNLNVTSNFINNININNFMRSDIEQEVNIERINGNVKISNLKLGGFFDDVNATLLEMDSVRTFGDQFISSPLIIATGGKVGATSIDVKNTLNDVPLNFYFYSDKIIELSQNTKVEFLNSLTAENSKILSDIIGVGSISNFNIQAFEQNRLSKNIKQVINVPVEIRNLITKKTFASNIINGLNFETFKNYMRQIKNYRQALLSGQHKIDSLVVDGDVNLQFINDRKFDDVLARVIWLNRENSFSSAVVFLDDIDVEQGGLKIDNLFNGKDINHFLKNWIPKTENPIVITGNVTTEKDVMVEENLSVKSINDIAVEDILRKQDVLDLWNLNVIGSVTVNYLKVKNSFNAKLITELSNLYSTETINAYEYNVINSDVNFHQATSIAYLNTPIFNAKNVHEWMNNLIKFDDSGIYIRGSKTFKGSIVTQNGLYVDNLNDVQKLEELIKNIILINGDTTFYGDLIFEDDVYADIVALRGNLTTDNIDGCYLREWIAHAMPIDQKVEFKGEIRMNANDFKVRNLTVDSLNGILFNDIITMRTNQSFDYLNVAGIVNVEKPIRVKRFYTHHGESKVQVDLQSERENSVMVYDKNVTIRTPVIFINDIRVLDSITSSGRINSKHIENIVLLNSSPKFDSKINFRSLDVQSIISNHLITGLDFNKWYDSRVWKNSKNEQLITGDWSIKTAVFNQEVSGSGFINGRSINDIERNLKENVNQVQAFLSNYTGQYSELCEKMKLQADNLAKSSIHIIKYFELDFKITEEREIFSFHEFSTKTDDHYLLINTDCTTHIYKWVRSVEKFLKSTSFESGIINDYVTVDQSGGDVYVITNSKISSTCKYDGLNSWKLEDNKLIHIKSIRKDVLELYIDPQLPSSFYALDNSNVVSNFDSFGVKFEEWKLPSENITYNFLPHGILPEVNLYNGRRIFSLHSRILKRNKRTWFSDNTNSRQSTGNWSSSQKFIINKPEYSIPIIQPLTSINVKDDKDVMEKIRNVGKSIRANFGTIGRKKIKTEKSSDTQVDIKPVINYNSSILPDMFTKSLSSAANENFEDATVTSIDNKKQKPFGLLFSVKNPNLPHQVTLSEKLSKSGGIDQLKLKSIGKSIFDAITNPSIPSNESEISDNVDVKDDKRDEEEEEVTAKVEEEKITTESNLDEFTPRIIINENIEEENISSPASESPEERIEATEIQGNGIRDMENNNIPESGFGEIIVISVGPADQKIELFAVSKRRNSFVVNNDRGNDFIVIYSDIIEGRIFQDIQCKNPSHITAIHLRDETLLAFMESRREVKILIYRGIQGFIFFKSINLSNYAHHMTAITVPPKINFKCESHYLVIQINKELQLMKIKIDGNCGVSRVNCDLN